MNNALTHAGLDVSADTAISPSVGATGCWLDRLINFAIRLPRALASRARCCLYRALGMRIGRRCRLARIHVPRNPWDVSLAGRVALDAGVVLLSTGPRGRRPRIRIGRDCYVNRHAYFDAALSIEVGDGVMIGPFCYITDHDHGMAPGVPVSEQSLSSAPVVVEDGTWLGAHVCVLKGVRIGVGAVVGAGAVVTHDVPPGAIAAGVPARVIGWR